MSKDVPPHAAGDSQGALTPPTQREQMLSTLMSNLPGMVYRCRNDPHWTMEFVSEGCRGLTGYEPRDLIGDADRDPVAYAGLIHPDDLQHVWDEVQRSVRENQPFELTYRIRTAHGEEKWVWERGRGVYTASGEVLHLEGFITDVSATRRDTAEQQRSHERLGRLQQFLLQLTTSRAVNGDDLDAALSDLTRVVAEALEADWVSIALLSEDRNLLCCKCLFDRNLGRVTSRADARVAWDSEHWVALDRERTVVTVGTATEGAFDRLEAAIRRAGQTAGVVQIECGDPTRTWTSEERDFTASLADLVSLLIEREERRRAQAERDQQHVWLKSLLDASADPVIFKDRECVLRMANETLARTLGRPLDRIIGHTVFDWFPRDQAQAYHDEDVHVLTTGEAVVADHQLTAADGSERWFEVIKRPIRNDSGEIVGLLSNERDVTERRQAEERLRQSEETTRAFLNASDDAMSLIDTEGRILALNNSAAHRYELAAREIHPDEPEPPEPEKWVGRIMYDLLPRDAAEDRRRHIEQAIQMRRPVYFEYVRGDRLGSYSVFPVFDARGQVTRLALSRRDITESHVKEEALKESEQRYRTLAEALARSNAELEQFANIASHDLQEPLRMVASFVQLLQERYQGRLDLDADEFIGYAVDGARRMQRLIDDLLTYSRVTTQGRELQPTDAGAALQQALHNLRLAIVDSGATVTYDPLPTLPADEGQLVQVFQNLIGNAVKFHGEQPSHVHVWAKRQGAVWRFAVRDNGIGLESRYAERIFVIFQRLHGRNEYPGTGIGLAICQKVVERHGGRIWVESEPGQGATFYFTLPTS